MSIPPIHEVDWYTTPARGAMAGEPACGSECPALPFGAARLHASGLPSTNTHTGELQLYYATPPGAAQRLPTRRSLAAAPVELGRAPQDQSSTDELEWLCTSLFDTCEPSLSPYMQPQPQPAAPAPTSGFPTDLSWRQAEALLLRRQQQQVLPLQHTLHAATAPVVAAPAPTNSAPHFVPSQHYALQQQMPAVAHQPPTPLESPHQRYYPAAAAFGQPLFANAPLHWQAPSAAASYMDMAAATQQQEGHLLPHTPPQLGAPPPPFRLAAVKSEDPGAQQRCDAGLLPFADCSSEPACPQAGELSLLFASLAEGAGRSSASPLAIPCSSSGAAYTSGPLISDGGGHAVCAVVSGGSARTPSGGATPAKRSERAQREEESAKKRRGRKYTDEELQTMAVEQPSRYKRILCTRKSVAAHRQRQRARREQLRLELERGSQAVGGKAGTAGAARGESMADRLRRLEEENQRMREELRARLDAGDSSPASLAA